MVHRASVLATLLFVLALPASAHAEEPWPCLWVEDVASFVTPVEGVPHHFDAGCSSDVDGHDIVLHEWDLDGDGHFETSTGRSPLLTHTFADRGAFPDATVDFAWKVTDSAGESASYSYPLRITDAINSWFNYAPQLVNPADELTLDATTAHTNTNPLVRPVYTFTWDLDGDGSYETATGGDPSTKLVVPDAVGVRTVGLRVTDGLGNASVVRREVEVLPRHPSRDQLPWDAPENLKDAPPLSQTQTPTPREAVGPAPEPVAPAVASSPAEVDKFRAIRSTRARFGTLSARVTLAGPAGRRFRVVLKLAPKVARSLGFGRRTVVLGSATGRLGPDGTRTITVRWNRAGRRAHRGRPHPVQIWSILI